MRSKDRIQFRSLSVQAFSHQHRICALKDRSRNLQAFTTNTSLAMLKSETFSYDRERGRGRGRSADLSDERIGTVRVAII